MGTELQAIADEIFAALTSCQPIGPFTARAAGLTVDEAYRVSALLDDLEASGILDDTLVMMLGEFGRTPRIFSINARDIPGRDHWAPCFFGVFAGGGVRGGQVIGRSDRIGAYPSTTPYLPDDVGATVYHVLGIDPTVEVRDRQNRPVVLNRGEVIQPLFTGRSA